MKSKSNMIQWFLYLAALAATFCSTAYLFYNQSVSNYKSDLDSHIRIALKERSYSLQKYIFRFLYDLRGDTILIVIFLSIMIVVTPAALVWLFRKMDVLQGRAAVNVWLYRWAGLFLIFVGALVIPKVYPYYNFYTFAVNCWHNQTTNEMRYLFLFCLGMYFVLDKNYLTEKKIRWDRYILYSLLLAADTWLKPSMFIGIAPVMAIWLLIDFFTLPKSGRTFGRMVLLALTVVPSLFVVWFQYVWLYAGSSKVGVGFYYNLDIPMQVTRTALFLICPLIIWSYNLRRLDRPENFTERRQLRQVAVLWLIEWLYSTLLNETGSRAGAGNFGWGIRIANFCVFAVMVRMYIRNVVSLRQRRKAGEKPGRADLIYVSVIAAVWAWQLFCGLRFFRSVMLGGPYWV